MSASGYNIKYFVFPVKYFVEKLGWHLHVNGERMFLLAREFTLGLGVFRASSET